MRVLCGSVAAFLVIVGSPAGAGTSTPVADVTSPGGDRYPGVIGLEVDATDLDHRVMTVHEHIPVGGGGALTLLFPKWSIDHVPDGPVDRLADLHVTAAGKPLGWARDLADAYTFHIVVSASVPAVDVSYQVLASLDADQGPRLMGANMLDLQWPTVLLYPAGYGISDINYSAAVRLPAGWRFASALAGVQQDDLVKFPSVPMDVLADSPMMAAKYLKTFDVADGPHPVRLDLAAETPGELDPPQGLVEGYHRIVAEAQNLFGAVHYDHFDLMVWKSGDFGPVYYEHRQSGESSLSPTTLKAWATRPEIRSVFAHDYVHSWNAMFRRPAGMAAADLNTPQQADMTWVTEGLTEYWRGVLAVRAGLITRQDYLNGLADLTAQLSTSTGASWRPLRDVGAAAILPQSNPEPWPDWQRDGSEAYGQGQLIWMEVDAIIHQQTDGRRSLDDFAKAFFGFRSGADPTYTRDDIVAALNRIAPYDWASFFHARVDEVDAAPGLAALQRAGYRLVFSAEPSPAQASLEARRGAPILRYVAGLTADGKGKILSVAWNGSAWRAGLIAGGEITAVNGVPYSGATIKAAVIASSGAPLSLSVKTPGGEDRTYAVAAVGGLRYPHLRPIAGEMSFLDDALKPRVSATGKSSS